MGAPYLEWHENGAVRRIPLNGPITIGRTPDNMVQLNLPGVSRSHCTVLPAEGGSVFVDARGSTNGVRVRGERLQSAQVRPGESFEVGGVAFSLGGVAAAATEVPSLEWTDTGARRQMAVSGTVTIGRTPENTIQVNDPAVSRRHASVTRGGRGVVVDASESANGVRVAGERVGRAELALGESFQVGPVSFGVGRMAGANRVTRTPTATWIGIAAAIGVLVVGLGVVVAVLASRGGGGGDPNDELVLVGTDGDLFPALAGEVSPVQNFDAAQWQSETPDDRVSLKLPPGWEVRRESGGSGFEVLSPEGAASSQPYGVRFRFVEEDLAGDGFTPPEPIDIGDHQATVRRDRYLGLPWHQVHVSVPMDSGFLIVEAPFGPGVNLEPQMLEILRGLNLR